MIKDAEAIVKHQDAIVDILFHLRLMLQAGDWYSKKLIPPKELRKHWMESVNHMLKVLSEEPDEDN